MESKNTKIEDYGEGLEDRAVISFWTFASVLRNGGKNVLGAVLDRRY